MIRSLLFLFCPPAQQLPQAHRDEEGPEQAAQQVHLQGEGRPGPQGGAGQTRPDGGPQDGLGQIAVFGVGGEGQQTAGRKYTRLIPWARCWSRPAKAVI